MHINSASVVPVNFSSSLQCLDGVFENNIYIFFPNRNCYLKLLSLVNVYGPVAMAMRTWREPPLRVHY